MSQKLLINGTLILTICFIILGFSSKKLADSYKGVSLSSGVTINGKFVETSSGRINEDEEKYESYKTGGTIFYILAGVTGTICIVSAISKKKRKN